MKILYLITGLSGGGAEKVVANLADQMSEKGHEVKIAYLKGQVEVRPENKSIELIYIGLETLVDIKKAYQKYKKLIKEFRPNIVHAHMVQANIFARISRNFCSVPKLICTAHSNNEGGKARMLAYRLTHTWSDLTTNVSQSAVNEFEYLKAVPKGEMQVVYNGIDLNNFQKDNQARKELRSSLNITDSEFMLLAVGRLHVAKDYPNLLKAFSIVLNKSTFQKKICLIIVGDGEEKTLLEDTIKELELKDNVQLVGRRNDVAQLMSAADLFVSSSSFEGFGLVVAEAMACQTYVVATDCGGVKEVMGGTGILVPPKNSYKLADAILEAIEMDNKQILENNVTAYNHVKKNFDLKVIVEKWLDIYAS